MAKGLLAGAVCGAAVAVASAAALSLYVGGLDGTGMPKGSAAPVVTPDPDTAAMPADPAGTTDIANVPPKAVQAEDSPITAEMPQDAVLPDSPPLRFEPAPTPETAAVAPPAPAVRPGDEAGIMVPDASALDAPTGVDADAREAADTTPGEVPDVADDSAALPPPQEPDATTAVAVSTDTPVMPTIQSQVPAAPRTEPEPSVTTEPAQPPVPQVPQENSGLVVAEPDAEGAPRLPVIAPAEEPTQQADAPAPGQVAAVTPPEPERPAIGTPGVSLVDRGGQASRLPSVGTDRKDFVPSAAPDAPLSRYAVNLELDSDLPLMAIVLLDDPDGPLGPDALDAFPFPLTFAIDPSRPGAAARMKGYRDQGFEVVVLGAVPSGAQASDVEVALEATLSSVPEAVAVLEPPSGGLQSSRQVSDQVTRVVRDSGHGLVLMPNGLNTAQALALRDGVAAATVFRDFDQDGQDARTIRRFLDGAAFRARQNGNVIMLGRLRADTISALLLWGLQDRAAQVALVPVSMVLKAESAPE